MSTTATSSTARKVIGSLGVIGAAAAVAGLGTFGSFTDSSTPVATTITSGTLSIDATQPHAAFPVTTAAFVPGDSITRAIALRNDGTENLGGLTFTSTATKSSILDTRADGLKLTITSCTSAWTAASTCGGTTAPVYSGAVATRIDLAGSPAMTAGQTAHLLVTVELPAGAGNDFQNKSTTLSMQFDATQRTGTAR
jgi:Camelysin metallo-endopeptidase